MPLRVSSTTLTRPLGRCLSERGASSPPSSRTTRSSFVIASSSTSSFPCSSSFCSSSSSSFSSLVYPPTRSRRPAHHAGLHTSTAARASAAATAAAATSSRLTLPADYVPPTQPPSAKRPELRKAQLLRTYTSLLRSTPLMLIFQHSNLTGPEWTALRRELILALDKAAEQQAQLGVAWPPAFVSSIRMQVIKTRMFDVALRVTEFFDPTSATAAAAAPYNHDLSAAAYAAIKKAAADGATAPDRSVYGQLSPLLVGPLAVLTFPAVSPAHLAAALSVLAPSAPAFPAPPRRRNPGYYEPAVQSAVQKLLLVGGRVEGQAFDTDGVRWVGAIEGGRTGLQAQLVALLQSAGLGLTTALEGASKNLWLTMESRKTMLEEDGKPDAATDAKEA